MMRHDSMKLGAWLAWGFAIASTACGETESEAQQGKNPDGSLSIDSGAFDAGVAVAIVVPDSGTAPDATIIQPDYQSCSGSMTCTPLGGSPCVCMIGGWSCKTGDAGPPDPKLPESITNGGPCDVDATMTCTTD